MSSKLTIVHVINSLERGGAETLLVSLLPELNEHYNIILVTLMPDNDFDDEAVICQQRYCLNYKSIRSVVPCVFQLRRIINRHNASLVRSQLYLSSIIARIATPANIPMVFSIHNPMSLDSYKKNGFALPLERLTYKKRHHIISVSNDALKDFDKYVGIKGRCYTLYNFINQIFVDNAQVREQVNYKSLRLVAVGNLKEQKNYFYLTEAFKKLNSENITLDIYGEGHLRHALQKEINKHALNLTLKGKCKAIDKILPEYDLYVLCSSYEGFGIAPIEAMAIGLPLLLSDLPVLREVTHNNALFFDPQDPDSFIELIEKIISGEYDLKNLSETGIQIAKENYQQKNYFKKLDKIYTSVINTKL